MCLSLCPNPSKVNSHTAFKPTLMTSSWLIICKIYWGLVLIIFIGDTIQPFSSVAQSCLTLWLHEQQHARTPCPSPTPGAYPNPMSIESVMPSNHLILCHHLLLPSIFPSIWVFLNQSGLHTSWPQYCSFNISPSNEHPGLIASRMDWLDLLAVQGTLKSLLQHTTVQKHQFFSTQLSL